MPRFANSVWVGALVGALVASMPLVYVFTVQFVSGPPVSGPALQGPSLDQTRVVVGTTIILALWVGSGAVNGALGVCIGRRERGAWMLVPLCVLCPAAAFLGGCDSTGRVDLASVPFLLIMAGCLWVAGLLGTYLGHPIVSPDASTSRSAGADHRLEVGVVVFCVALVVGAGVASMYFVLIDREQRRVDYEWQLLGREQRLVREREQWDKEREVLLRDRDEARRLLRSARTRDKK